VVWRSEENHGIVHLSHLNGGSDSVIARLDFLLNVRVVVAFVDDDQPQVLNGAEKGAACSNDDGNFSIPGAPPGIIALAGRES